MDNIHKGHRQRLRDVANKMGINNLPEHQVLELLLSYIIPQKDTNPLAHKLISKFGSLAGVFEADRATLEKVEGIGSVASSFISTLSQIPQIYKTSKIKDKQVISCPSQAIKYFAQAISIDNVEKFYMACLNSRCEVVSTSSFTNGNNNKIIVDIKELVQIVLNTQATGIIICHTHPEGEAKPSKEDIIYTKRLFITMQSMNIKLLDHIILNEKETFSFLNEGLLDEYVKNADSVLNNELRAFRTVYKKD